MFKLQEINAIFSTDQLAIVSAEFGIFLQSPKSPGEPAARNQWYFMPDYDMGHVILEIFPKLFLYIFGISIFTHHGIIDLQSYHDHLSKNMVKSRSSLK